LLMLGLYLRIPYAVELVYTLAFIAWAASSYRLLVPRLRESAPLTEASARF
jgi:hypothetical protein